MAVPHIVIGGNKMSEMKKVYITSDIPDAGINKLKEYFEVVVNNSGRTLGKEELIGQIKDADAVICLLSDNIDKYVLESAKKVKIFANYAVGYNNIDIEEASKNRIMVTNTPDVLTDATADLAWALLFSTARRVVEADKFTREDKFKGWHPKMFLGADITGKTLGIIGAGRIGRAFAKRSIGFDMKILYHNRNRNEAFEEEYNAIWVDKETLLKEADFISLHCPLTEETRHSIGKQELDIMKKSAILINTSRGPVIDEKALAQALKEGKILGAGLDVFENEPAIEEELKDLWNVVILPHIGSATTETRDKMAVMAAENVIDALMGGKPRNLVNNI